MQITRQQCGCTCRNQTIYAPGGYGMPMCPVCSGTAPCEYLVIFGCQIECDGLASYSPYGYPLNKTYGVLSLLRENFMRDATACEYTERKPIPPQYCVDCWSGSPDNPGGVIYSLPGGIFGTLDPTFNQYQHPYKRMKGLANVCNPSGTGVGDLSTWRQFFPSVRDKITGFDLFGSPTTTPVYDTPIFGCIPDGEDYQANWPGPAGASQGWATCGWWMMPAYDCNARDVYLRYMQNCTRITWKLTVSGGSATLVGTSDSGNTVTYNSTNWDCNGRSTLQISAYPCTWCNKFPKEVCVVPSITAFPNYCSSPDEAAQCCDSGTYNACFLLSFTNIPGIVTVTGRNAPLPSGVTQPSAGCGWFWGTGQYFCPTVPYHAGYSIYIGNLWWCNGGTWQNQLYCSMNGTAWTLIGDGTVTQTRCFPDWRVTASISSNPTSCFCWPQADTVRPNCCPSTDIPKTIYDNVTSNDCPAFSGQSVPLEYVGNDSWVGYLTVNECTFKISVVGYCGGGFNWTLGMSSVLGGNCPYCTSSDIGWNSFAFGNQPDYWQSQLIAASCNPFLVKFVTTVLGTTYPPTWPAHTDPRYGKCPLCVCGGSLTHTITE